MYKPREWIYNKQTNKKKPNTRARTGQKLKVRENEMQKHQTHCKLV